MTATPVFPDELLPIVAEFRSRVKRLLGKPRGVVWPYRLGDSMLIWWNGNGEIGVGDPSNKRFDPILVTVANEKPHLAVLEWGSLEEIERMMQLLREHMVLNDLADV